MKKDYNIQFLPPVHHGSRLTGTPTARDIMNMHDEMNNWIKSKEKKEEPKSLARSFGILMIILWGAPLITALEYLVIMKIYEAFK
jgi:hypothetical protein